MFIIALLCAVQGQPTADDGTSFIGWMNFWWTGDLMVISNPPHPPSNVFNLICRHVPHDTIHISEIFLHPDSQEEATSRSQPRLKLHSSCMQNSRVIIPFRRAGTLFQQIFADTAPTAAAAAARPANTRPSPTTVVKSLARRMSRRRAILAEEAEGLARLQNIHTVPKEELEDRARHMRALNLREDKRMEVMRAARELQQRGVQDSLHGIHRERSAATARLCSLQWKRPSPKVRPEMFSEPISPPVKLEGTGLRF